MTLSHPFSYRWATEEKPRPASGSLVQMITKSGETELKCE